MKRIWFRLMLTAFVLLVLVGLVARADRDDGVGFAARLSGFQEVTPKVTNGQGMLRMQLSEDGTTLSFRLGWTELTGPPTMAHIHFAQRGVNGVIVVFFCGPTSPFNTKPACEQSTSGSATGTITAADIKPLTNDQGFVAGDFAELLRAIRHETAYANIHTAKYPGGEIRGQIRVEHSEDSDR